MRTPHQPGSGGRRSAVLYAILGIAVIGSTLAIAQRTNDYRFFDPLIEVKTLIDRYAAEEPDLDDLQLAAIEGMIEALDDPYALYVPPRLNEDFEKELTGEYVGIGAEVNSIDGVFTIVTPMDDSPAFRAGLMAGDKVRYIDGQATEGLSVDESIDLLLGEDGTEVTLTVERDGETIDITITRGKIKARAVRGYRRAADENASWDYMLDPQRRIGYIRVSQFTPSVAAEFEEALREIGAHEGGLAGLIIDVRWNPGGLLDQAVRMADLFLEEGVIVSTKGRAFEERFARAAEEGTLPAFPIAVLINGQSASASEVLAGALVENDRAIAVGERSFGKGSVQSVHPLGGGGTGGSLKLTEQRYYLPSGRSLQRTDESVTWGVDPTPGFLIAVNDDDLRELLRVRREAEIIQGGDTSGDGTGSESADPSDPAWITEHLKDRQLAEAVRAVRTCIETGSWPESDASEQDASEAVAAQEMSRLMRTRERMLRELDRLDTRLEAVRTGAGDNAGRPDWDLWADDTEIEGGRVIIRDEAGNEVAVLRITGPDLERWLIDADVEPAGVED